MRGGDTDPRAEALGIACDGERRLGRCLHQQIIDHALVLVGDVTQLARQRVDDVKIRHWQELRLQRAGAQRLRAVAQPGHVGVVRRRLLLGGLCCKTRLKSESQFSNGR